MVEWFAVGSAPWLGTDAIDRAIEQIVILHRANGGSTFNLFLGDLSRRHLYAVSSYPDRCVVVAGRTVSVALLRRFVVANLDLLIDPRNSVGTWFDPATGRTHLDVSTTVANRDDALDLGRRHQQVSIFSLAARSADPARE